MDNSQYQSERDQLWMRQALQVAKCGQGRVEPNPMVGCIVVQNEQVIASGYHAFFGGPHAEVNALQHLEADQLSGATIYVTLEPCNHFGKTPPCVDMLLAKRPTRIVVGMVDPFKQVSGTGIQRLRQQGITVDVGVLEDECRALNAPYLKLLETGRPWLIAKWAMTLDGAIATKTNDSKWISNERSRAMVHAIRARMDGIVVGYGTASADDPLLTARLPNDERPSRIATRIVMDTKAQLRLDSQLVNTTASAPVIVVTAQSAERARVQRLIDTGCEIMEIPANRLNENLEIMLDTLGNRRMTNVLIEGGSALLGHAFDRGLIDEVHVFIATKIVGGAQALRPIGGNGQDWMNRSLRLDRTHVETIDDDIYIHGLCRKA